MKLSTKITWIAGVIVLFIIVQKCNNSISSNHSSTSRSDIVTSVTDSNSITNNIDSSTVYKWSYLQHEDKMTSNTTYFAQVESRDRLDFDSPYNGGATATLSVRRKNGRDNVYITFSKGQLMVVSYEPKLYKVRFDKKPYELFRFVAPSDGSSTQAFIKDASEFIRNVKQAKKVIIELEFYREGLRQIEFDISDFKWRS